MSKFIEVTLRDGEKCLVNLDSIVQVEHDPEGCIMFRGYECLDEEGVYDYIVATESYDQIRSMIASCQGGIPIGRMCDG